MSKAGAACAAGAEERCSAAAGLACDGVQPSVGARLLLLGCRPGAAVIAGQAAAGLPVVGVAAFAACWPPAGVSGCGMLCGCALPADSVSAHTSTSLAGLRGGFDSCPAACAARGGRCSAFVAMIAGRQRDSAPAARGDSDPAVFCHLAAGSCPLLLSSSSDSMITSMAAAAATVSARNGCAVSSTSAVLEASAGAARWAPGCARASALRFALLRWNQLVTCSNGAVYSVMRQLRC